MPELETARLQLRHFTPEDLDDLYRIYRDSAVMQYLRPRTLEQTRSSLWGHIHHWDSHGFGMWAVAQKPNRALIGRCGLAFLDGTPEVELGYVFDKPYWGRGIATEAALATLEYGFNTAQLDRIVAIAHPDNLASRRVIEKVGMVYEKEARYYETDVVYYALGRSDWNGENINLKINNI
jgi:ribosomal-protein-alanine N-acetyltransferase